MKWPSVIGIIGVTVLLLASAPVNNGFGFPDNGPCTPPLTAPGFCNDSGVLVSYDTTGKKTPVLNPGPKGDKGDQGLSATVAVGSVSSGSAASVTDSGTQSAAVLNFVIPKGDKGDTGVVLGSVLTVTLVCPKGSGTVQSGFTSTACTIAVTGIK